MPDREKIVKVQTELELKQHYAGVDLGDTLSASIEHDGRVSLMIDNPWAGDAGGPYGATGSIELNPEQTRQLHEWLGETLNRGGGNG